MDIAAFMTWIRETIMKMGGMQTCDLVYEETNPEGHFFQDIFTVGTNIGYTSQLLLLGKVEYGGGPIFKVVLEC